MYTRRDKRERKKRKKHPHTPRACHTLLLFFFFLLHRGRGRPAVKRSQVVTGRRATVIDASSPALCVCVPPPLFASSKALFCLPCCVLVFRLGTLLPPRPRHCFFFHQRRDCLSVLHEQLHQKYNLTAQFTLRVFLSFARSVRGRPPAFFSSVCECVVSVHGRVRVQTWDA